MLYLSPSEEVADRRENAALAWAKRHGFLLLVIVPTLIVAIYLFFIASGQYRSEAQFVVRGIESQGARASGVSQLLGMSAALSPGQEEAQSIREYLRSHDAIRGLRELGLDLVGIYRRPGTDVFSELWSANPPAETLLDYYRDHVDITYDPDDNITHVSVRAFRPSDAQAIARALLRLGEARVNEYNARLYDASLKAAFADVEVAERDLATVQARLGAFREVNGDIDPAASGAGGLRVVEEQQAELDRQTAMLADMRSALSPSSPQVRAMEAQVRAMAGSLASARGRLTGQPQAVSGHLGQFEDLRLQQDFAAKRYETARSRLVEERARAARERLFVIAVVEPNLPEKPALPKPFRATLLIFLGLCVAYGIGWMLLAGVREHQA